MLSSCLVVDPLSLVDVVPEISGRNVVNRGVAPPRGNFRDKDKIGEESQRGGVKEMSSPYLLELLDGTLVNTTALVDQVTCVISQMAVRCLRRGSV
jgi:hypothetical protein